MQTKPAIRLNISGMARKYGDKAVKKIAEFIDHEDPRVALDAAKEILNRGYGKPLTMTADVTNQISEFDDSTLDAAISALRASIESSKELRGGESAEATAH